MQQAITFAATATATEKNLRMIQPNALAQHERAYQEALAAARVRYEGRSLEHLLAELVHVREYCRAQGMTHTNVARAEVLRDLLGKPA